MGLLGHLILPATFVQQVSVIHPCLAVWVSLWESPAAVAKLSLQRFVLFSACLLLKNPCSLEAINFPNFLWEIDICWSLWCANGEPSAQTMHLLWLSSIIFMLLSFLQTSSSMFSVPLMCFSSVLGNV